MFRWSWGIPLASLVGPVFFGLQAWPVAYVIVFAMIWQLAQAVVRREAIIVARQGTSETRYNPAGTLIIVYLATTVALIIVHLAVYYVVLSALI
jgi:hypothetical protein